MIQANQVVNQESSLYLEELDFKNEDFFHLCLISLVQSHSLVRQFVTP